jgi:hypothetical protein
MSRLIDADKIIDSLGNSDMDFAIGAVIDEQPTAFDVDKVVEQLEEVEKIMTSPVTKDCFGEECRASDCTVCLISKAIEIVKGGELNE